MDELKQLFKELLIMVQQYGDSSYNAQRGILKEIIKYMEGDDADNNKFSQAKWVYKNLFFPKSPLSEFYIWKEDFAERKKLNDLLESIKNRLWEILK